MGKKRRAESAGLDDLERDLYASFSAAASSISHLYTSSVLHQKRAFVSGRKKSLERMREWLIEATKCGKQPVSPVQILNFLKAEESVLKSDELGFQAVVSPQQGSHTGHEEPQQPQQQQQQQQQHQQQQRNAHSSDNLRRYRIETLSVLRRSSQLNTTATPPAPHPLSWNGSRCHTENRAKLDGAAAPEELVENKPPARACRESGPDVMANQAFWKDGQLDDDGTDTSSSHAMDEE